MLKSCAYCGRIHSRSYTCDKKPQHKGQRHTEAYAFHHSNAWTEKSKAIRARDNNMCLYCAYLGTINTEVPEAHHIVPIAEDYNARLDDSNLISLCRLHHEQAEKGLIDRVQLLEIVARQEQRLSGDYIGES